MVRKGKWKGNTLGPSPVLCLYSIKKEKKSFDFTGTGMPDGDVIGLILFLVWGRALKAPPEVFLVPFFKRLEISSSYIMTFPKNQLHKFDKNGRVRSSQVRSDHHSRSNDTAYL